MKKAFTLIELLIVVAIIAILAAIAVPNFLEAQTRAKVSRTKADMRTQATGMEAYVVDHNAYPPCHSFAIPVANDGDPAQNTVLERLSTPVAYITAAAVRDPFKLSKRLSNATARGLRDENPINVPPSDVAGRMNSYIYQSWDSENRASYSSGIPPTNKARSWLLHSCGPDSTYYNLGGILANDRVDQLQYTVDLVYDATNGTISRGSIWRTGGQAGGGNANYAAGEGLVAAINRQP